MKRFSLLLLATVLASLLGSCGIFKNSKKSKHRELQEIRHEAVKNIDVSKTTSEAELKVDSLKVEQKDVSKDKSKIVEETESVTTKKRSGGKSVIEINKDDVSKGEKIKIIDSLGNTITAQLDSLNKKLVIEIENAPIDETQTLKSKKTQDIDVVSESNKTEDRKSTSDSNKSTSESNKQATAVRNEDIYSKEDYEKESSPDVVSIILYSLFGLLVIYVIYKFIIKNKIFRV